MDGGLRNGAATDTEALAMRPPVEAALTVTIVTDESPIGIKGIFQLGEEGNSPEIPSLVDHLSAPDTFALQVPATEMPIAPAGTSGGASVILIKGLVAVGPTKRMRFHV